MEAWLEEFRTRIADLGQNGLSEYLSWPVLSLVIPILILLWSIFLVLAGVEGWILKRSVIPWLNGFIVGFLLAAVPVLIVSAHNGSVSPFSIALACVIGAILGALCGTVWVWFAWAGWFARIAAVGLLLGGGLYMLLVEKSEATLMGWIGCALLGSAVYAGLVFLLFPLVWFFKHSMFIASSLVLLISHETRIELEYLCKNFVGIEQVQEFLLGRLVLVLSAVAISALLVAYVMWIQRFWSRFYQFVGNIADFKIEKLGLSTIIKNAVQSVFITVVGAITLTRSRFGEESKLEGHMGP